jgi:hypothetical protein
MPWLPPLGLVIGVIALSISVGLGVVVLVVVALGLLPYLRLQHLKEHPPDPELRRRNFWQGR